MNIIPFLALSFCYCIGWHCVFWQNSGCSALLTLCAAGLTCCGLSVLDSASYTSLIPAIAVFSVCLLQRDRLMTSTIWRECWRNKVRQLQNWSFLLLILCGAIGHWFPALFIGAAIGLESKLSGDTHSQSIKRLALCILALLAGSFLGNGNLGATTQTIICILCLSLAILHLLPAANELMSLESVYAVYCLFVFLFYYYTISI